MRDNVIDHEKLQIAFSSGMKVMLAQHKLANKPIVVMLDGKMTWIQPDEFEIPEGVLEVVRRCNEIFRDREMVNWWMNSSCEALGSRSPIEVVLETPGGTEQVLMILGRIEYGVYS